ncbi:MAG: T9SS type A sorting domain-containing protein [Chitinivibrionia bacterium]|nr:T9SS type A sorting domain-containing protein [Chitinivibrionia bacterium]
MKKLDLIKVFAITAVIASETFAQTIDWSAPNITITTAAQLKEFAAMSINGGNNFRGQTIKLGNNIDLNGNDNNQWTPIGGLEDAFMESFIENYCNENDCSELDEIYDEMFALYNNLFAFQGIFDGAGFVVSGIYTDEIDRWWHWIGVGLFGAVGDEGTIKNLGVSDSYIESDYRGGGLAGLNNGGTIENCYATIDIDGDHSVGGLVGWNVYGTIKNCYATGNVNGFRAGGLVGVTVRGTITNCYATGNVEGDAGSSCGGLVGWNDYGTIENCYAIGNVKGMNVGGLVGNNYNEITSGYYDSETSGQSDEGKGEPKTTAEMKQQSTYSGWDFANIWAIDPAKNNGYPYLDVIENAKTPIAKKSTKKTAQTINFAGIKNGQINLNLKAGTYTVQLYNLQGRLVKSVDITATNGINATNLRIDNLSKGIFILNVKQAGVSLLKQKITVK